MPNKVQIIQDISLLYELSLSVGSSLDPEENCQSFLRKLIRRMSLNFGAIWLNRPAEAGAHYFDLFCIYPAFRKEHSSVAFSPEILQELSTKPYISITSQDPQYIELLHEKNIDKGAFALFNLGEIGILKLFASSRLEGFSEKEMAQLQQVVDKLSISLNGCFAHIQLKKETESRMTAQKGLEEGESKLRRMIDSSLDGVGLVDSHGKLVEWNVQAEKMFGFTRKEALGQLLIDLIVPQRLQAQYSNAFFAYFSEVEGAFFNKRHEIICVRKNGTEFPAELSLMGDKNYNNVPFVGYVRDITERQEAQRALRESEEKYRGVLENMEMGLLEVDIDENIIGANNAFCQMLGYTHEELVGRNTLELFLPDASKGNLLARLAERKLGQSSVYELQFKRKNGASLWALISGAPVKNLQGEIVGTIGIHFDMTARKNLETELAEAKFAADRARTAERQFLTHMSHEIRTPINAVIGMTHLLYQTQPNTTQLEYLNSLRFSADSLLGVIDNILDLSKIDAGEITFEQKSFDLAYLLRSLLQVFKFKAEEKDLKIMESFDPAIKNLVIGDPTRLNQILTNLLGNALKFTEKGTISLATALQSNMFGKYNLEFRVTDTGIGIAENKRETIFEYFKQADVQTTRKFGGTGLGLTIVKQLVELQGGTIRLESQLGVGSSFIFMLQFGDSGIPVTGQEPPLPAGQKMVDSRIKGMHFLVVEDNIINQQLICKTIETWDCTFEVANNGVEALHKTAQHRFDVILMDIHMPDMDGCETTMAIRINDTGPNRNTPIIALTAAAMADEKRRAMEAGMNGFLTKPISPKMLLEHLLAAIPRRPVDQIDLRYLLDLSHDDQPFVQHIITSILTETPDVLQALEAHAKNKAWEQAGKLLHQIKPNFAMLGMEGLQAEAISMEEIIKAGDVHPDQMQHQMAQFILKTINMLSLLSEHTLSQNEN